MGSERLDLPALPLVLLGGYFQASGLLLCAQALDQITADAS